jgi:carbon storage regulator
MLVLSRKKGERIVIAGKIFLTVVDVRGDKARIGLEAPADVPIHRQEVYDAIQRGERRPAVAEAATDVEVVESDTEPAGAPAE